MTFRPAYYPKQSTSAATLGSERAEIVYSTAPKVEPSDYFREVSMGHVSYTQPSPSRGTRPISSEPWVRAVHYPVAVNHPLADTDVYRATHTTVSNPNPPLAPPTLPGSFPLLPPEPPLLPSQFPLFGPQTPYPSPGQGQPQTSFPQSLPLLPPLFTQTPQTRATTTGASQQSHTNTTLTTDVRSALLGLLPVQNPNDTQHWAGHRYIVPSTQDVDTVLGNILGRVANWQVTTYSRGL